MSKESKESKKDLGTKDAKPKVSEENLKDVQKTELTDQEQAQISYSRQRDAAKKEFAEKLGGLMQEYGVTLSVNPNSPIGNPQITVVDSPKQRG